MNPFEPPQRPPAAPPTPYGQQPHGQTYGQPQHAQPYGQTYAYAPQAAYPQDPRAAMRTAAGRARAASVLLWVLVPGWLLVVVAGACGLDVASEQDSGNLAALGDAADLSDATYVLSFLAVFGLGTALWVLLALWSSWTARTARAAGRGREASLAHLGWWGLFVPLAGLVLPVLAYVQSAQFVDSARHQRHGRTSPLLIAWWVLAAGALLLTGVGAGFNDEDDTRFVTTMDAFGWLLVAGGLVGAASAAVGALALRQVATDAQAAAAS